MSRSPGFGPLAGMRVVEFAGIGPAPMCCMLLADLGADIVRLDRTADAGLGVGTPPRFNLLNRGRRSVAVDLKSAAGVALALRLVEQADVLIEGFRPGVMERMGLGPKECQARNPRLVYGRMTGWGQAGPLADAAGHDMNYIALVGALHAIGRAGERPVPPLNLVGDFGGGALYLAFGVLAALFERQRSGRGQVVDAAMTDGAASLMTIFYGLLAEGRWRDERGVNILDGAAPWYDTYETRDGKFVSVAPIEAKFYAEFMAKIGLDPAALPKQGDARRWPEAKAAIAKRLKEKTRDEWAAVLEGSDACFAPVLSLAEAPQHPHNAARETFVSSHGIVQPNAAPRFDRTPGALGLPPAAPGEHTDAALADWGFSAAEIAALRAAKAVA
jgi:alpha-methylacyl-CoA racemase